jgi:hypothetical protein
MKDAEEAMESLVKVLVSSQQRRRGHRNLMRTHTDAPPVPLNQPNPEVAKFIDGDTYVTGTKKVLVMPICPEDSSNCFTQSYPYGFCYGKVRRNDT